MKITNDELNSLHFNQYEDSKGEWCSGDGDYSFNTKTNQLWFINDGIQKLDSKVYGINSNYELIKVISNFKDLCDTLEALGYYYEEN